MGISLGLGRPSVCVRRRHARPTNIGPQRYTGYLLYWYKSTNTDVEGAALVADTRDLLIPGILISALRRRHRHSQKQRKRSSVYLLYSAGAQFTCFTTRIKVFYYRRRSSCGALQVLSLFVLLLGQKYLFYYRRRSNCGALQMLSLYEGSIKALFRLFSGSFKALSEFCEGSIKSL